jgi:hypothetical protein
MNLRIVAPLPGIDDARHRLKNVCVWLISSALRRHQRHHPSAGLPTPDSLTSSKHFTSCHAI